MPTFALKKLPLARSSEPVLGTESIELDVEDLLDIDGSDDQTLAVSRGLAKKLAAPKRIPRVAAVPAAPPSEPDDARPTIPFGLEAHAPKPTASQRTPRMNSSSPAHFAFAAAPPRNPPSSLDVGSTIEPVVSTVSAPAHFAPQKRNVSSSYPPIAIAVAGRERALSFIQERPSRAGWIAAAVIAVVLVIGGSIRVQSVAPAASAPPAELSALPAPAAAVEAPSPAKVEAEPKVVQFGEDQGVAIKPAAPTKAVAPVKHAAAPVKAVTKAATTTKLADGTLSLSDSKSESKVEKTERKAEKAVSAAEKKKQQSIQDELAEAQLRAAAR